MNDLLTNEIQLNWLRTFEVAGKHLSFTLAAKELNMSQPAVSQQIQLLEHHLQQQLFVRANRGIQLTDSGRAFLPLVHETIWQLNSGAAQIFSQTNEAIVDVSVNSSFAILWLSTHLIQFNASNPNIIIRQQGSNWSTDYEISTADLEIRYGSGNWAGFDSFSLVQNQLRPYCAEPIAEKIQQQSSLQGQVLLEVIGTTNGWEDWLKSKKMPNLKTHRYQLMDSHAIAAMMAVNGAGVCLMYDDFMQKGMLANQLVAPFSKAIDTKSSYYLCHRSGRVLSEASQVFKDWLLVNF